MLTLKALRYRGASVLGGPGAQGSCGQAPAVSASQEGTRQGQNWPLPLSPH